MNLLTDEINEVTRYLMKKLMAVKVNHKVHVGFDGHVETRRADCVRNALPVRTVIGTYNHRITHAALRDDLLDRREQLQQQVAA
ncbi:hypothetical protein [Xanthomonas vasicola]|uniref:hypothetical protein n=1 Tax=Xanthomonas vasicola TaxID=56459 RepID=UPI0005310964|nr:hypothetical protein [Xanthomonas vasicola]KGR44449.1 hypothetical protein NX04_06900 [Xanthomonas vasicola]TWQ40731.1 hypothetical protein FQJ96_06155 [Xanthomonas vasicola]TWQ61126.1 hypothetical protein FQJ93_03980 [Xanthomonas vasicola]TWQ71414.1 hypothetical protein FQJ89_22245 [Xanthomonas vasicola]